MRGYGNIREKVIRLGRYGRKSPYIEVDIIPNMDKGNNRRKSRRKRIYETEPKQKLLNTKRAIRYLFQLIKCNFTNEDYRIELTYSDEFIPDTEERIIRNVKNYIDRVNRERKKAGLKKAKYICINERGRKSGRVHHHMLISGGLDRDKMESLWCDRQRKGQQDRQRLGYVNCDRLQFTKAGIDGLSFYITKDMKSQLQTEGQLTIEELLGEKVKGKRRWMQSKGLIKPWSYPPDDFKYSRKTVEDIVKIPPDCGEVKRFFERIYKGYELDKCEYEYNEHLAQWSIYLKLHLII